jgi:LPXTG-site transpeptidase (sortase) family protein
MARDREAERVLDEGFAFVPDDSVYGLSGAETVRPAETIELAPVPPDTVTRIRPEVAASAVPSLGPAFSLLGAAVRAHLRGIGAGLDRRTVLDNGRRALIVVGALMLLLASFLSFAGGMTERESQRELNAKFTELLAAKAGYRPLSTTRPIPPGSAVALIEIPYIHLRQVVIEGTTSRELAQGPGHLRSTPLPGQHGNAVIAGRRTTFGGPFHRLNELRLGDRIVVTTALGRFTYLVMKAQTIDAGKPDRLGASMRDILTLTTSDPPYRATRRLVVVGLLHGRRSIYADPLRLRRVDAVEASFFGDASQALPAALWELALFAALIATRILYRRWRRWPTYLITTPIILAITFAWLLSMAALLPSTL